MSDRNATALSNKIVPSQEEQLKWTGLPLRVFLLTTLYVCLTMRP